MYGLTPVTFPLPRLNRRTTSSPNVSSAIARLITFSFGYRDAVPLTGVLYQKVISRALRATRPMPRHVGGLVLKMALSRQRPSRYRERSRRHADERVRLSYDQSRHYDFNWFWNTRHRNCGFADRSAPRSASGFEYEWYDPYWPFRAAQQFGFQN